MKQRSVLLTPRQRANIDKLLKQAKFDRLVKGLLSDKTTNADTKSKLVYALKKKIFDNVEPRKSRF
jgi:hypothetical protein